jgi:hypothetical protein
MMTIKSILAPALLAILIAIPYSAPTWAFNTNPDYDDPAVCDYGDNPSYYLRYKAGVLPPMPDIKDATKIRAHVFANCKNGQMFSVHMDTRFMTISRIEAFAKLAYFICEPGWRMQWWSIPDDESTVEGVPRLRYYYQIACKITHIERLQKDVQKAAELQSGAGAAPGPAPQREFKWTTPQADRIRPDKIRGY